MIGIKKRDLLEFSIALSVLFLGLKPKKYEIPPPIKPPKLKISEKLEEKLDILPPPPPLMAQKEEIVRKLKKPVFNEEWLQEKKVKKGKKNVGKELKKLALEEKRKRELKENEKRRIERERETQKRIEGLIEKAEEKRKLEEERAKQLKVLRKQREKEKLKSERYIKKIEEVEKKKKKKGDIKEIKDLLIRLNSGIEAIDKHEKVLEDDIEKNLMLTQRKLEQVEIDLKTEDDYINESEKIKEKIESFEELAEQGKTDLDIQIKDLRYRYNNYIHKAEGIRRAILAKIGHIRKTAQEVEKEERKQKGFEEEKKKILEVEQLLAKKRLARSIQRFFRKTGLYKTKEDIRREKRKRKLEELRNKREKMRGKREERKKNKIETLLARKRRLRNVQGLLKNVGLYKTEEEKRKEEELAKTELEKQEKRIAEEKKKREIELKTREALEKIRKFQGSKAKKGKQKIIIRGKRREEKGLQESLKKRFRGKEEFRELEKEEEKNRRILEEKLKKTEDLREREKEDLRKGNLFIHLFKPKKIKPEEEIKKAIDKLKVPSKKVVKPALTLPATSLNDIEYINQRIADARESLLNFNLERAKKIYVDVLKVYNNLSVENKKKTYESIKELYDERKNAERVKG